MMTPRAEMLDDRRRLNEGVEPPSQVDIDHAASHYGSDRPAAAEPAPPGVSPRVQADADEMVPIMVREGLGHLARVGYRYVMLGRRRPLKTHLQLPLRDGVWTLLLWQHGAVWFARVSTRASDPHPYQWDSPGSYDSVDAANTAAWESLPAAKAARARK